MISKPIKIESFDDIDSLEDKIFYLTLKDKDIPNTIIIGKLHNDKFLVTFEDIITKNTKSKWVTDEELKNTFKPISYSNILPSIVHTNVVSHPDPENPF